MFLAGSATTAAAAVPSPTDAAASPAEAAPAERTAERVSSKKVPTSAELKRRRAEDELASSSSSGSEDEYESAEEDIPPPPPTKIDMPARDNDDKTHAKARKVPRPEQPVMKAPRKAMPALPRKISGKLSTTKRAGLMLSVPRARRVLRRQRGQRVSAGAAVYLAAVTEYLMAEMLEVASSATAATKHKRITPRDMTNALKHDAELSKVVGPVIFRGAATHEIVPRRSTR